MNILDTFKKHFSSNTSIFNDFSLIECDGGIMIGVDKSSHISVVIKSSNGNKFPIKHKTQNMSIECNVQVSYNLNGNAKHDVVHMKKLKAVQVTTWLEKNGYLRETKHADGRKFKITTEKATSIGISYQTKTSDCGRKYSVNLYNENAQRFIIEHLDEIVDNAIDIL